MSRTNRVLIQDLVKDAAYLGVQRKKAASEAAYKIAKETKDDDEDLEKDEDGEYKEKESNLGCNNNKHAASEISSKYANSLASALEYIGTQAKLAEDAANPPDGVSATDFSGGAVLDLGGKPLLKSPPLQSAGEFDPSNQISNDMNNPPGDGSTQKVSHRLYEKNLNKLAFAFSGRAHPNAGIYRRKHGSDLNVSASGENGGAPAGGMPVGPTGLIASNESARDYTRRQAYANRKEELRDYFSEAALSQATDPVLSDAFAHTAQAGAKVASASIIKRAAARALYLKLTGQV